MSRALAAARTAQARHARVCAEAWGTYINAIRAAREAGHSLSEIGHALGLTRSAVHYLSNPDPRKEQANDS
jgi:hypothetical protein